MQLLVVRCRPLDNKERYDNCGKITVLNTPLFQVYMIDSSANSPVEAMSVNPIDCMSSVIVFAGKRQQKAISNQPTSKDKT